MNKKIVTLSALLLISGSLFSARSDCFNPYSLVVNNNSGGLLEVKKTKGMSGVSRKTDIEDGQSITAMIKKRGSEIKVVAGPEDNKSTRSVDIFSKVPGAHRPQLTFTENGVEVQGFYTQQKEYRVEIANSSGGIARILDACAASGSGQKIAPGKSTTISVKANAYIVVEIGPEKRKLTYRINFADQTGKKPTITLGKRSFMSNGIAHKDLDIQARRTPVKRLNLEAKVDRKRSDQLTTRHTKAIESPPTAPSFKTRRSRTTVTKSAFTGSSIKKTKTNGRRSLSRTRK